MNMSSPRIGSVEILVRNQRTALGGSSNRVSTPAASGILQHCDSHRRMIRFVKKGSRGCPPWAASPSGGERGSPSQMLQRVCEQRENEGFNRAPQFTWA
jgi:hypothetical protein